MQQGKQREEAEQSVKSNQSPWEIDGMEFYIGNN